jgi:hypothetical protein
MAPKEELFEKVIEVLQRETNIQIEKKNFGPLNDNNKPDGEVWIRLPNGETIHFQMVVKRTLNEAAIIRFVREHVAELRDLLLVTNHVHRKFAIMMKNLGIQFIDTDGNMYINHPPAFIFIHGYQRKDFTFENEYKEGMFGPAGLKVVFTLLCKRALWNANYREIKTAANTALGTVANTVRELTQNGYLIQQTNKQMKLIRRKELFDKWVDAYIKKTRPKNIIGRFKITRNKDTIQTVNLKRVNAFWGGEIAAYLMTRHLKPEITTIYANKPINNLILFLMLRRDKGGDIEIRERFWNFDIMEENQNIVPPILIYADLIATGDARNIETAKLIYDDYLEKHIGEN